jgi:hypothetical protein
MKMKFLSIFRKPETAPADAPARTKKTYRAWSAADIDAVRSCADLGWSYRRTAEYVLHPEGSVKHYAKANGIKFAKPVAARKTGKPSPLKDAAIALARTPGGVTVYDLAATAATTPHIAGVVLSQLKTAGILYTNGVSRDGPTGKPNAAYFARGN